MLREKPFFIVEDIVIVNPKTEEVANSHKNIIIKDRFDFEEKDSYYEVTQIYHLKENKDDINFKIK